MLPPPPGGGGTGSQIGSTHLCLGWPLEGTALHLGRGCPGPATVQRIVYPQRGYRMIHNLSLIRLSDGQPVPASEITLGIDADSWAWTWSATLLGTAARDLVMPSAEGEPVTLQATIDGHPPWHLIVEEIPLERRHGSNGIRASGRGLTAELAAPYYLPDSGYLENARTIQQAMLEQLPLDDSWTLTWDADTPDWLLPAGALTWSAQTPIQILQAAAQGTGLVLIPATAERSIHIQPRYPVAPWN